MHILQHKCTNDCWFQVIESAALLHKTPVVGAPGKWQLKSSVFWQIHLMKSRFPQLTKQCQTCHDYIKHLPCCQCTSSHDDSIYQYVHVCMCVYEQCRRNKNWVITSLSFLKLSILYVTSCRPTPTPFPSINTTAMAVTKFSGMMRNIEITSKSSWVILRFDPLWHWEVKVTLNTTSRVFLTFSVSILINFEAKELSICITTNTAHLYLTTHTHK